MTTPVDRDSALVAALRRGDPMAAEDLVVTYGDRAGRLAVRITRDARDAEEVVQDAFLSVIRKIHTFRGDSAFGSWIYRIVANASYQRCRTRRGRDGAEVSLDKLLPVFDEHGRHVEPVADWSMSLEDPARRMELRTVLSTAIDELPIDYRVAVLLRDVEGLSHREIAETLGVTAVAVKTRVHRARLLLRKRLDAHFSIADGRRAASVTPRASRPRIRRSNPAGALLVSAGCRLATPREEFANRDRGLE